jgi:hypothetical protein
MDTVSILWAASSATVTRASSPAPLSPSAMVSVTRQELGGCSHYCLSLLVTGVLHEAGMASGLWVQRGHAGGCCANQNARVHCTHVLSLSSCLGLLSICLFLSFLPFFPFNQTLWKSHPPSPQSHPSPMTLPMANTSPKKEPSSDFPLPGK